MRCGYIIDTPPEIITRYASSENYTNPPPCRAERGGGAVMAR